MTSTDYSWARPHFEGRQVLVSGGTSGIGNGIARAFAEAGADVLATGATEAEIAAAPGIENVRYARLDVRDAKAVETLVAPLGPLAALVNCAGINRRTDEFDPAVFADVVDINLNGTNRLCQAARPKLAGGAILNFASMFSFAGASHAPAYAASKGAVAQLTKSLAIAFAPENIRVNAVAPGWIETAMTVPARSDPNRNAMILARTPMARWGTPEDVAAPALFLCSPLAGFITGAILPVDGGYLAV
jgi:NAD(P)-dependent dehydrogenase (short-subunit alcohol dehydrogenase family)